jgi:hypothetical protein
VLVQEGDEKVLRVELHWFGSANVKPFLHRLPRIHKSHGLSVTVVVTTLVLIGDATEFN